MADIQGMRKRIEELDAEIRRLRDDAANARVELAKALAEEAGIEIGSRVETTYQWGYRGRNQQLRTRQYEVTGITVDGYFNLRLTGTLITKDGQHGRRFQSVESNWKKL